MKTISGKASFERVLSEAQALFQAGDFEKSKLKFGFLLEKFPESPDLILNYVLCDISMRSYKDSLRLLDRINPEILLSGGDSLCLAVAYLYRQAGKKQKALTVLAGYKELHTSTDVLFRYAQTLFECGHLQQCLNALDELDGIVGPSERTRSARAPVLNALGDYRRALEMAEEVLASNPLHFESLINCSTALIELEDFEGAEKYIERAIAMDPGAPEPWVSLANIQLNRWDFLGARKNLERAFPGFVVENMDPRSCNLLANLYASENRPELAEGVFYRAIKVHPESADLELGYANYLIASRDFSRSKGYWESRRNQTNFSTHLFPETLVEFEALLEADFSKILFVAEQGVGDEILALRLLEMFFPGRRCRVAVSEKVFKVASILSPSSDPILARSLKKEDLENFDCRYPVFDLIPHLDYVPANWAAYGTELDGASAWGVQDFRVIGFIWKSHRRRYRLHRELDLGRFVSEVAEFTDSRVALVGDLSDDERQIIQRYGPERFLFPEGSVFDDLSVAIDLISQCDHIVGCPSANSHIAMIMRKPTRIFAPPYGLDPSFHRGLCPGIDFWYPNAAVFRRSVVGEPASFLR